MKARKGGGVIDCGGGLRRGQSAQRRPGAGAVGSRGGHYPRPGRDGRGRRADSAGRGRVCRRDGGAGEQRRGARPVRVRGERPPVPGDLPGNAGPVRRQRGGPGHPGAGADTRPGAPAARLRAENPPYGVEQPDAGQGKPSARRVAGGSICVFRPFLRLRGGQAGGRTGLRPVRDRLSRGRAAGERGGHAVPPGEIGAGGGTDADELHPLDRKGGG